MRVAALGPGKSRNFGGDDDKGFSIANFRFSFALSSSFVGTQLPFGLRRQHS